MAYSDQPSDEKRKPVVTILPHWHAGVDVDTHNTPLGAANEGRVLNRDSEEFKAIAARYESLA